MKKKNFKNFILNFFNTFIRFFSKLIYHFYKYKIVILREDRIGHQIGNFDNELFKAEKIRRKNKIETIFLFVCPRKEVANSC